MIASMTGFGAGRSESELGTITIELRSVNSRFLDLSIRLPNELSAMESDVRQTLQKSFQRGKITVSTRFASIPGAAQHYSLNTALLEVLEKACEERGEKASLEKLLSIPGVVIAEQDDRSQDMLRKMLGAALKEAAGNLEKERHREGASLAAAISDIHKEMVERLSAIKAGSGEVVTKYREKLHERLEELLGPKSQTMDEGRLEQEVALFADKADISEELVRLETHLAQLADLIERKNNKSKGRPLDFLCQELLRETNTIGSKSREISIAQSVLEMKNLVENLKEQVANIE